MRVTKQAEMYRYAMELDKEPVTSKVWTVRCPVCQTEGMPERRPKGDYVTHAGRVAVCRVEGETNGAQIVRTVLDDIARVATRTAHFQAPHGQSRWADRKDVESWKDTDQ